MSTRTLKPVFQRGGARRQEILDQAVKMIASRSGGTQQDKMHFILLRAPRTGRNHFHSLVQDLLTTSSTTLENGFQSTSRHNPIISQSSGLVKLEACCLVLVAFFKF